MAEQFGSHWMVTETLKRGRSFGEGLLTTPTLYFPVLLLPFLIFQHRHTLVPSLGAVFGVSGVVTGMQQGYWRTVITGSEPRGDTDVAKSTGDWEGHIDLVWPPSLACLSPGLPHLASWELNTEELSLGVDNRHSRLAPRAICTGWRVTMALQSRPASGSPAWTQNLSVSSPPPSSP
jgi:hypothetical protein